MSQLNFDLIVNLSADEFTKLVSGQKGMTDKDMLMMITRFENDILDKIKHKDGEKHERYLFFKRVLDIMYMAMQSEEMINFWKNVAIRAKMGEEFHSQNATIYFNDLMKYKAIEEVINSGHLDDYITAVKQRNGK